MICHKSISFLDRQIEERYISFCREESYIPLNINIWGQVLKQKFKCKACTMKELELLEVGISKRIRGYQGIRIKCVEEVEESR